MRALSVRQPWAWQIINQRKNIENRTRNVAGKYRGPVAIHASLKPDLVDAHEAMGAFCPPSCRPWGEHLTGWHLVFDNPRPLPLSQQIPCRGALGLWTPSGDVLSRLTAAVSA